MARTDTGLSVLADRVAGSVVLPGDPSYGTVGKLTIGRFDQLDERLPAVIVRCVTASDVVEALAYARAEGLPVAVRGGAHSFAEYSSTDGLLIDLARMDDVRPGPAGPFRDGAEPLRGKDFAGVGGDVVTVGPGVRIAGLASRLAAYGRTVPCGWCPTVGVTGAVLGGGYGALGRLYGLGCDHLLAAEVVLADGRIVVADADREPDLFWALRGAGGGNFGVVTSLLLRTRPAVPTTTFHCWWTYRHAAEVVAAWQRWAPDAPGEVNAEVALLASGDPAEPPVVVLFGVVAGGRDLTSVIVGEFAGLVGAGAESVGTVERPATDPTGLHSYLGFPAGDVPPTGRPLAEPPGVRVSRSEFFDRALPADAIERLVSHYAADRVLGQYRDLELVPWGGAYSAVRDTAFAHRDARFLLKHAVELAGGADTGLRHAARDWLTGSAATLAGHGTGGVYPNYPEPDLPDWPTAYHGPNLPRLTRVKATYDPHNTFTFAQSVPLAR